MQYEKCQCLESQNAILYTLLSRDQWKSCSPSQQRCLCQKRSTVCLQTPQVTCQAASDVLVKTVSFVKNLPSFQLLPWEDQLLLLDNCWAPLFLLGLVQEMVTFEVIETPAPSMLKRILLDDQCKRHELQRAQPTLASVQRLQCSLNEFWSLDLSPKEYAYLKGAILFNPSKYQTFLHFYKKHHKLFVNRGGRVQQSLGKENWHVIGMWFLRGFIHNTLEARLVWVQPPSKPFEVSCYPPVFPGQWWKTPSLKSQSQFSAHTELHYTET